MKSALSLCLLLGGASAILAQTPAPPPAGTISGGVKHLEFEVASIKPAANPMSTSNGGATFVMVRGGMRVNGNRMEYTYASLRDLVKTAYNMKDFQVVTPEWMTATRYDVTATLPAGTTKDDVPEMLQSLLAERFKLTVHREQKDHDIYAMVAGKGGPKLTPTDPDNNKPLIVTPEGSQQLSDATQKKISEELKATAAASGRSAAGGTAFVMTGSGGTSKMQMRNQTLAKFADSISRFTDRPVFDKTGIEGSYDFILEVSQADMMRGVGGMGLAMGRSLSGGSSDPGGQADDPGGSIAVSLQKYGLKLEKKKAPVDVVTVDHCEKTPTEN